MGALHRWIRSLDKAEVRQLKLFASRTQQGEDRKDLALFDALRQAETPPPGTQLALRLYGPGPKATNALHRLQNRVLELLGRSLLALHGLRQPYLAPLGWLMLARHLSRRQAVEPLRHCLERAERLAQEQEDAEALDLIYSAWIEAATTHPELDPEPYIHKRQANLARLARLRELDDVVAVVTARLRRAQNLDRPDQTVLDMLHQVQRATDANPALHQSPRLRLRLVDAVAKALLSQHRYPELQAYLEATYPALDADGLLDDARYATRLRLLTYLGNAAFKTGNYAASLHYAHQLGQALDQPAAQPHRPTFALPHANLLLINYYVRDIDQAIALLQRLKQDPMLHSQPGYEVFVLYNFATCWMKKGDYRRAVQELTRLAVHEAYPSLDPAIRLKMALAELVARYELDDEASFHRRVHHIRRELATPLQDDEPAQTFLQLLTALQAHRHLPLPPALRQQAATYVATTPPDPTAALDLAGWLRHHLNLPAPPTAPPAPADA